ncbi:UvrD-helicase-domain-containing protein, partial [Gloeophyllum trabeum ATCC 11539]
VAVRHPHDIPLQILAGPGSGKTKKVLTSRIAYLILHEHVQPSSICAVTFTNKAAREMKERLTKVIGKAKVDEVKMGTFHALCALFLRRYPTRVGIKSNFTVCDADESKKILKKLLGSYKDYLEERNITLDVRSVTSIISKAKSRGESWRALAVRSTSTIELASQTGHDLNRIIAELYEAYEKYLRENNSLDFDDLLVYGVELFSRNKEVIAWCTHVLVDEFQDTNTLQYELMRHIASVSRCVTIVGDPDQSIYGWRSAEVANLAKMRIDFPSTVQILLEENYRSTASILRACMSIVAQDHSRIQKTLHTSHPDGCCPVLQCFPSEQDEAACIAREIKRLSASSGGMLGWEDFVILLRMNSLSRSLESALRKEGIPCRVLKGQKFFERLEIKDLLAYLQVVDNPDFVPAFERVINVPPRGIGDKTLGEILRTAQGRRLSPVALVEHIYDSKIPDIKPSIKRKVGSFVRTVRELRLAAQRMPADIIRKLISLTEYEDHLKKTQPDSDARWENVMELMSFASEAAQFDADGLIELKHSAAEGPGNREALSESNPLRLFLQASQLSGDSGDGGEGGEKEKVTISTCHSAKGLEWPVVFIPAVEEGTFPFALSEDLNEERRLLYVACTRAQNLLYLSHCNKRLVAGRQIDRKLSAFVASVIEEAPVRLPGT